MNGALTLDESKLRPPSLAQCQNPVTPHSSLPGWEMPRSLLSLGPSVSPWSSQPSPEGLPCVFSVFQLVSRLSHSSLGEVDVLHIRYELGASLEARGGDSTLSLPEPQGHRLHPCWLPMGSKPKPEPNLVPALGFPSCSAAGGSPGACSPDTKREDLSRAARAHVTRSIRPTRNR